MKTFAQFISFLKNNSGTVNIKLKYVSRNMSLETFKNKIMATIYLETLIKADIHTVFDLARDIDLHQKSTRKTNEKAIAGRTSGLIRRGNRYLESKTFRSYSDFDHKNLKHGKTISVYRYHA